jgi:hypothetical protein
MLQPTLSVVQSATASLVISRWKAPGSVRAAAQANVDSIQRDLGSTLPGLLSQADAAPDSVPPLFAVFSNLDALYDVLLRVSSTANLAAPESEADTIASALSKLEAARTGLGNAIISISQRQEAHIASLETAAKTVKVAPAVTEKETVIDDGPAKTTTRKTKKKSTSTKSTQQPSAGNPAPGSSS